jgi:hypothetical protein
VADADLETLYLQRDDFHGEWNHTLIPRERLPLTDQGCYLTVPDPEQPESAEAAMVSEMYRQDIERHQRQADCQRCEHGDESTRPWPFHGCGHRRKRVTCGPRPRRAGIRMLRHGNLPGRIVGGR